MAHTKSAARKLATKAEMTLLDASFPSALKDITPGRLKQKITRARKLESKYRDLAKQQRGEARGKRKAKSTRAAAGNANTVVKQEIFAEARARFEGQLEKLEAKAAKELVRAEKAAAKAAKTATKTAAKTATKTAKTVKKTVRKTGTAAKRAASKAKTTARKAMSVETRGVRKAAAVARSGSTKHQGHVGARGRRRQAKRDSR